MKLSLGSHLLQLLLQSPALCPPPAHSLLGPGLQFISGPRALLKQCLHLPPLRLPSALKRQEFKHQLYIYSLQPESLFLFTRAWFLKCVIGLKLKDLITLALYF